MRGYVGAILAMLLFALWTPARAEGAEGPTEAQRALLGGLHPRSGTIALPAAETTLTLGDRYDFLDAAEARRVLTEGWGNPPGAADGVLGMIFPRGKTFLDDGAWAAVITYEQTFYVSDKAVSQSDYDKLLAEMKSGEDAENTERNKGGFEPVHLVGWAEPPSYDPARHNLIWARDIRFGSAETDTLNYDVRHLGRRGVLSLNIVAQMPQLAEIRQAAHGVAAAAEFNPGARYADHQWTDKSAGYGLVGLVAAGAGLVVAKKLGFLALAALFAKKGIVVIGALGLALVNWVRRLFGAKPMPPKTAPASEVVQNDAPDEVGGA